MKQEPGKSVADLCKPWTSETSLADLARQKVRNVQIMEELIERIHPQLLPGNIKKGELVGAKK